MKVSLFVLLKLSQKEIRADIPDIPLGFKKSPSNKLMSITSLYFIPFDMQGL
jgi:hypothetical protein